MSKRVLILGAGYSGLKCALTLEKEIKEKCDAEIIIADKNDYHRLNTQLPGNQLQTTGTKEIRVPLKEVISKKNIKFIHDEVIKIMPRENAVLFKNGKMDYDYLVIALGSEPDNNNIAGLEEHGLDYRLLNSEKALIEHIEECFKAYIDNPFMRDALTFVVGGAGLTGTWLIFKIIGWIKDYTVKYEVPRKYVNIIYIDNALPLMTGYERQLAEDTVRRLLEEDVRIITDYTIGNANMDQVILENGEVIKTRTFVWTGAFRANNVVAQSGLTTVMRGRVKVNRYLQAQDFPNVYVTGDNAFLIDYSEEEIIGPSAHISIESGITAAKNIVAELYYRDPVPFKPLPETANKINFAYEMSGDKKNKSKTKPLVTTSSINGKTPWKYLYSLGGFRMVARKLLKK